MAERAEEPVLTDEKLIWQATLVLRHLFDGGTVEHGDYTVGMSDDYRLAFEARDNHDETLWLEYSTTLSTLFEIARALTEEQRVSMAAAQALKKEMNRKWKS